MHGDGRLRQLPKHDRRIAPHIGRVRQQDDLHFLPLLMQPSRRHKAIAAVIPLAAENHDAPGRSMMREHIIRHGRARILHQRERRHAEALAGGAINGSHLFCGNDFHKTSVSG